MSQSPILCTVPNCIHPANLRNLFTYELVRCINHKCRYDVRILDGSYILWTGTQWKIKCEHKSCTVCPSFGKSGIRIRCKIHHVPDDIFLGVNYSNLRLLLKYVDIIKDEDIQESLINPACICCSKLQHTDISEDDFSIPHPSPRITYPVHSNTSTDDEQITVQTSSKHIPLKNSDTESCYDEPSIHMSLRNKILYYPICSVCQAYAIYSNIHHTRMVCKIHKTDEDINIKHKIKCSMMNCQGRATYTDADGIELLCKHHRLDTHIKIIAKCRYKGCKTIASFGNPEIWKKVRCKLHKLNTDIHMVTLCECGTPASYGVKGKKRMSRCNLHKLETDIQQSHHIQCAYPNCKIRATYGDTETKVKLWCKLHHPKPHILISRKCYYNDCKISPSFFDSLNRLACKTHRGENYRTTSKLCEYPECTYHASIGPNGKKMHCSLHRTNSNIKTTKRSNDGNLQSNVKRPKY